MKLSVIIPVFNEEQTVGLILQRLDSLKLRCPLEIIVIDDGSTDRTPEIIQKESAGTKNMRLFSHKKNLGKGAALQTGIKNASGDFILIQDADLEYDPGKIPELLEPVLANPAKEIAVYGSRFMKRGAVIPFFYLLGNRFLTVFTNLLFGSKLTDMETGYKLLPGNFTKKLKLNGKRFDIEPEITARLLLAKIKIIEVPISYRGRTQLAGKKLTFKDAFGAVLMLLKLRFGGNK